MNKQPDVNLNADHRNAVAQPLSEELFEAGMLENMQIMSRTSKGVSDTSSSIEKPKLQTEGNELAKRAQQNYRNAVRYVWERRHELFSTPESVRQFIVRVSELISHGLLKDGQSMWRTWQTDIPHQVQPEDIQDDMLIFYDQFYKRLGDVTTNPVAFAAWVEKEFDSRIHPLADGCGRAAKTLSGFVLARSNHPLPQYRGRDEYYAAAAKSEAEWEAYYRSLFEEQA